MRASLVSQSREAEPTDWLSNLAGRRAHRGGHGAPGCLAGGGRDVAGSVSFRKPTTFGLSSGLTIITLAWATGWLRVSRRARWLLARRYRYRPESAGPYNQDS